MTPDVAAGLVPRPSRPWRLLAWLRGLLPRREPDAWRAASDERLARLEAEVRRESGGPEPS